MHLVVHFTCKEKCPEACLHTCSWAVTNGPSTDEWINSDMYDTWMCAVHISHNEILVSLKEEKKKGNVVACYNMDKP